MEAYITMNQLWLNPSVRSFFFRGQSENTLQELCDDSKDWEDTMKRIDDEFEFDDLDDFEEMLYNDTLESIKERIGTEYFD